LNNFDKVFKIIGLFKFEQEKEYNIFVKDDDGCAELEFTEVNVTARICQIELLYFIHSKYSWQNDITIGSSSFNKDLGKLFNNYT
jgi:hypothetical protein